MGNNRFMYGVAAALWKIGIHRLDPRDPASHRAFSDAINELGSEALDKFGIDFYVDPITGNISDLFSLTSNLQGFALARRPNPTYPETELDLDEEACETLLSLPSEERALVVTFTEIVAHKLRPTGLAIRF